jgi:hypothetical protein
MADNIISTTHLLISSLPIGDVAAMIGVDIAVAEGMREQAMRMSQADGRMIGKMRYRDAVDRIVISGMGGHAAN